MNCETDRSSKICSGALAAGLACLYLILLPSHLTWANYGGDSGDFLSAILTGGVPHPSGYPTYMLLGRAFQLLPFGSSYWRGALLSALPMACAAGLLCLWVARFAAPQRGRGWLAGLAAGLAWGTAPLVWSQALIVEVHGLQALFVMLWMWWLALLSEGSRGRCIGALAFLAGLSLGNHLTILLLAPALLAVLAVRARRGEAPAFFLGQAGLAAAGALVYLYLPLAARDFPPVNWGNPQSLPGFFWEVSGAPYRGLLFDTPAGDLLSRLSAWARLILEQVGLPGLVFGAVGAVQAAPAQAAPRRLLLWVFAVFSIFAIGYNTADSLLYMLPACLAAAAWAGQGLAYAWGLRWRALPLGILLAGGMAAYLLLRLPGNLARVDARAAGDAEAFAQAYLAEAPHNALLLTSADADTFPLWYLHYGLRARPDVAVIVLPLTQFVWYQETLIHTYPQLAWPPLDPSAPASWGEEAARLNPARPICRSQVAQPEGEMTPTVTYACH